MGICTAAGQIRIKPPFDSKIGPGDRLIVISVDERWQPSSWAGSIDESAIAERKPTVRQPERTLILGWNERVPAIVTGIDAYVAAGSEVCVVALDPSIRLELGELSENHRSGLVMRELEGLSYEEMAKTMGCSKGTIMSRLFHARKNMQKRLADLFDRPIADDTAEDAAASGSRG